jgi:phosphopantetheine adenylyltransferase
MAGIIFPGSFDPAHIGHLNTYLKAQLILGGKIKVCICMNPSKKNGLLSMEERVIVAESVFPTGSFKIFQNASDIFTLLQECKKIVRGYRNDNDIQEALNLSSHFGAEKLKIKWSL